MPPVRPRFSAMPTSARRRASKRSFSPCPNAKLAGEDLKTLTAEPHIASSPEDHKTAEYVAQKFRAAGLETEIVPYRVLMNQPKVVKVEAFDAAGKPLMTGPTPEHVDGDPFENDPRVVMPFNGSSGSGDVTGEVVYANYGRLEDFDELATQHIDLHGKIVIVRYGANFRGVKVYIAEQRGAVGVLIYSDPQDDGYYKGDTYPAGPVAARDRRAARVGAVSVQVSRRPGNARRCVNARSARLGAHQSRRQPAAHHLHPHQLSRCSADSAGAERPRRAAGLAGRASLPLSPRAPAACACTSSRSRTTSAARSGT